MTDKMPIAHPVSAGGVAWRRTQAGIEVVLCGQLNPPLWGLPKGTPNPGESLTQTARREVEEETGLKVEPGKKVGAIHYWFVQDGVRHHKTVHFYLMLPLGGSLKDHDTEFDVVRWFPLEEACRTLTYANEVKVLRQAQALLEAANAPGKESPPAA